MDIEKFVNSKWYTSFEWGYRLLILNVLMILIPAIIGGGPILFWFFNQEYSGILVIISMVIIIFSFIPCYITSFVVIKLLKEDKVENIFKLFFINLWKSFKDLYKLDLIIVFISMIFIFSGMIYWTLLGEEYFTGFDLNGIIAIVGFAILFFGLLSTVFALLYLPMIYSYFRMTTLGYIKLSFHLVYKHFLKTLIFVFLILAPIALVIIFQSRFLPIYMLYGISVPLFLMYILSRELFHIMLNNLDEFNDDEIYKFEGEKEDETRN